MRRHAVLASIGPRSRRSGVFSRTETERAPPPVACGKVWSGMALTVEGPAKLVYTKSGTGD